MAVEVRQIPVALVMPSPYQPRKQFSEETIEELAASIRQHGVLQPVLVRQVGAHYQLIAGERRLRAVRKLGMAEIPAIVRDYTDEQVMEAGLIENLQREEINVVEAARAFQRLLTEFRYSQAEIAQRTGKSRATVNNTLRLLQLAEPVLEALERGELTEGHARALLAVPYRSLQTELAEWVIRNAVPVRETERKVRSLLEPAPAPAARAGRPRNPNLDALEERLRRRFGTRARISYRGGVGTLALEFYSDEDLTRLLELLEIE